MIRREFLRGLVASAAFAWLGAKLPEIPVPEVVMGPLTPMRYNRYVERWQDWRFVVGSQLEERESR